MIENTIFARNRQGKKALALSFNSPVPELIEFAALAGFHAIHLDGEHGAFNQSGIDAMVHTAHAYGLSVKARVPSLQANEIVQWLDRGVQSIMAPHVETGEQAHALVEACYFAPRGHRSWGTHRGTAFNDETMIERYGGRRSFAEFSNANMFVFAQIESVTGYDNLAEILAVDGLHAIAFGPFDLAFSMGYPGEGANHPEVRRVLDDIEVRTRAAGKRLSSDYFIDLGVIPALLAAGRAFVKRHGEESFTR
jgi:2-keto-3-deoxy-L-rhamnonate aldolase RhmA